MLFRLASIAAAALLVSSAGAANYSIKNLSTSLPPSVPWASVNNAGDLLGSYGNVLYRTSAGRLKTYTAPSQEEPFSSVNPGALANDGTAYFTAQRDGGASTPFRLGTDGQFTRLPYAGPSNWPSYLTAINDHGIGAGVADTPDKHCFDSACEYFYYLPQAVIYRDGKMSALGTLGGNESYGNSVNNSGVAVGWSKASDGITHAFVYSGDTMYSIGASANAMRINDAGQVAGNRWTGQGEWYSTDTIFLYQNGVTTDIRMEGYIHSSLVDLNNAGQVLGNAFSDSNSETHYFLYQDGKGVMLDDILRQSGWAGWHVAHAQDINDVGQILLSVAEDGKGVITKLLLTPGEAPVLLPVPEPAMWAMLLAGFGAVGLMRRKGKAV